MLIAMYVIFGLLFLGASAMLYLSLKDFLKLNPPIKEIFKGKNLLVPASALVGGISVFLLFFKFGLDATVGYAKAMIWGGSLLFGLSLFGFVTMMTLHYKKIVPNNEGVKLSKFVTYLLLPLVLIFLFVTLDGLTIGEILKFPLPTGIPFNEPVVAFYALFIIGGALLVLLIADHEMYKKYGRHGILENVFYVAFPAGIVGARLWYVIGNWKVDGFDQNFLKIFEIREGGLAIMGGAVLGAVVGIWFLRKFRKEYDIKFIFDIAVPAILIAQAIGRWGNFFNQEVYGAITSEASLWYLPAFVKANMFISGEYRIPLFFIESVVNLTGYFVIRFAIGEGLKKIIKPLDLGFMYLVWYGVTRLVMEPMRDQDFNMGNNGLWSVVWSVVYIVAGVLLIVGNHIIVAQAEKKKKELPESHE